MKKIILTMFLASAVITVKAQEKPDQKNTSAEVSTQLKQDLQLNDNQYHQMQTVTEKRLERRKQIEHQYSHDPKAREAKIHETDREADAELSKILSEKQYNAYLELQGRSTGEIMSPDSDEAGQDLNIQEGNRTRVKSDNIKTETGLQDGRVKDGELKMKDGDSKIKIDDDKIKVKQEDEKLKVKDDKIKYESDTEEMKIKKDEEKYKSGDTKYKAEPGKAKLKQGDTKTKVKTKEPAR